LSRRIPTTADGRTFRRFDRAESRGSPEPAWISVNQEVIRNVLDRGAVLRQVEVVGELLAYHMAYGVSGSAWKWATEETLTVGGSSITVSSGH
jgi:hypothetical protein